MTVTAGPTVHGVYDYWLGGGQHLRADRELGRAIEAEFPLVPVYMRGAREFHLRAARWCAVQGITRFIRAGAVTALRGWNVHDAVREVNPGARVIYASSDPEAHEWAQALLAGDGRTRAVLTGPGGMLAERHVRAMLKQGRPVCVISGLLMQFEPPERAGPCIAKLAAALPPGSVFAVSMALAGADPAVAKMLDMFTPAAIYRYTAADLTRWLRDAGMEIVPPGVTDVRAVPGRRRPEWAERELAARTPDAGAGVLAGVLARVP